MFVNIYICYVSESRQKQPSCQKWLTTFIKKDQGRKKSFDKKIKIGCQNFWQLSKLKNPFLERAKKWMYDQGKLTEGEGTVRLTSSLG